MSTYQQQWLSRLHAVYGMQHTKRKPLHAECQHVATCSAAKLLRLLAACY